MAHDIAALGQRVRTLDAAIGKLHERKFGERLIPIARRPGWTTPQELALVLMMVESLQSNVEAAQRAADGVLAVAEQIGRT
jgi:hypothetical protein